MNRKQASSMSMTHKSSTTTLDSESGCKSSPGRTPLEQQQNTELKFSVSNKEALALPSEEEAVKKRQGRPGRGHSD